ncbi:MAG: hypothetical protein OEZ06_25240 [Myxococcales bacterium]|nr:hypothetical protein [Myxococcales bacterium]
MLLVADSADARRRVFDRDGTYQDGDAQGEDFVAAPELDGSAAGAAFVLLVGGALILVDRRRHA